MQNAKPRRTKLTLSRPRQTADQSGQTTTPTLDTRALFKGGKELRIRHNSETYRLSITKLGKLILTK